MARKNPSKHPSSAAGGQGNTALAIFVGGTVGIVGSHAALAGPTGGQVTDGQGSISTPTSTSTVIDQASSRLSIDWRSFDVAANESVRFNQPSSNAVALNRIRDQKPSEIFGRIDANGRVVLVNTNGMVFGPGSQINVGSLVASSLNVVSFDEASGSLRLAAAGNPGAIVNSGTINAGAGGSVSLVGGSVTNNGLIVADYGTVNLAAGRTATVDFYGGGLLRLEADSVLTDDGGAAAGVRNAGEISANGGQVLLTTSAVRNLFDRAVNNDGVVRANRIDNVGGVIRLVGEDGVVASSGVLDASGVGAGSKGGAVHVLGEQVGLLGSAVVDVSGDAGGGLALIGGDFQGKNSDILNSQLTIVGAGASIAADARRSGNGGRVIVWSDGATSFRGSITARGGAESGDGGFAETSGKRLLEFNGAVNMGSTKGSNGTLLLDPEEINIVASGGVNVVDWDFADPGPNPPPAPPPDLVLVNASAINSALNTTSVELQATDTIRVQSSITGTGSGNGIWLRAGDNININDGVSITTNGGAIRLTAGDDNGTPVSPNPPFEIDFLGAGSLNAGNSTVTLESDGAIDLPDGAITGGVVTLRASGAITDGAGVSITASQLVIDQASNTVDSVNLNANIGGLDAINIAGNLTLDVQGANAANFTVARANAGGAVTIDSTGSILDDDEGTATTTNISGTSVTLSAANRVGNVTDLRAGTGSSVDVNTAGSLTVTVTSNTGQMNLNLAQAPTLVANDLQLGPDGTAAQGTMLIQAGTNFNISGWANNTIVLGPNNSSVGFRSTGVLTVPSGSDFNDIFAGGNLPGTLALHGDDIADGDHALTFNGFTNLTLDSVNPGVSYALTTGIAQLIADIGGGQNLTVTESNGINLADVVVDGTLSTTANAGNIVVGTVNAGTSATLTASNGNIDDDNNNTTRITAATVTLNGDDIGDAGNGNIDLTATDLSLNADGDIFVADSSAINITAFTAANNDTASIEATGAITTAVNLQPSGGDLILTANGAGSNLDFTGRTLGAGSGNGDVTIRAGGTINNTGTIQATDVTLQTGLGGNANQGLTIGTVTASGTVNLNATGAIGDNIAVTTPSVSANTLAITSATTVDLDTQVTALNASGIDSTLIIREATGLNVTNAAAGGAITIATGAGGGTNQLLDVDTLTSGGDVSLTAAGTGSDIDLGTVTANAGAGDVTLVADGDITDNVGSTAASVIADTLTITDGSTNLDTNVNTLVATGTTAVTIRERTGDLLVTNAVATGAVNVTTIGGDLSVTNANGNAVTLGAGGVGNGLTIDTVTAATNVSLSTGANGAIVDLATTPSVIANRLVITAAGSANLDTNVNILDAAGITGALTIRETTGALQVDDATAGTTVNLTTVAGDMTGVNADADNVQLTSSGALALTDVDVDGTNGTATLAAGGAITGGAGSVAGNRLSITGANSVNLGTSVAEVNAVGVTTTFTLTDANDVEFENVTAGGAVSLTSTAGAILDDDGGTATTTSISGSSIALQASTGIGSVTDFVNAVGSSVDVNTAGQLTAHVTQSNNATRAINLNVAGAPVIPVDGILLGTLGTTGRQGSVLLQAPGALNLGGLNVGAISVGDNNTVSVGYVSGGLLTLRDTGSVTDFAPANLLVSGTDVVAGAAASRTIDLTAGTLSFNASAPGGNFQLNTTVGTLHANVGTASLFVDETVAGGNLALGNIVAGALDVEALSGSILDDGNNSTVLGGSSVRLVAGTGIGGTAANADVDVNTASLWVQSLDGAVTVNSTNAGVTNLIAGAATATPASGNGNLTIRAAGDISAVILQAEGDTVSVTTTGQILDSAPGLHVLANTLDINGATNVSLTTDVNTLEASGVTGTLAVTETTGALTVDASATGGVNVATTDGALNVTNAASSGGAVTLAAGGTGTLAVTAATASGAISGTTANGNITVANSNGGTVTYAAGGTGTLAVTAATATGALSGTTNNGNITVTNSNGGTVTYAAGGTGTLNVAASTAAGALTASTANGTLTVGSATSTGGAVSLTAGTGSALNVTNVTSTGATLTGGAVTLGGTVNVGATGTATIVASGAVTDAAGATPSVAGNQLTITSAGSANLDTNVNTLNATGVTGALTIREISGPITVANATAAGAVNVSTVAGALTVTGASSGAGLTLTAGGNGALNVSGATGVGATLTGGAITLGTLNAGTGTATLNATGAITDAAGATPSVVASQLTIAAGAASADLDTNVDTLQATNVAGALTIREASGPLTVANAGAGGAVNISTTAGALNVTSATSTGGAVTLNAGGGGALNVTAASGSGATLGGGAVTLGFVNVGVGTVTLAATGAVTDAAGSTRSVLANQLTVTSAGSVDLDTDVSTLTASGVTGSLTVREQAGPLTVANAAAAGAINLSTVGGDLTVTNAASSGGGVTLTSAGGALNVTAASGTSATLTSSAAMTIGNVNAGAGAATLSAAGTITDGATGSTSLTAGAATVSGTSIGSAGNTLNTAVTSLSANSTGGGMFFRDADDIALTSLTASSNQDIVVVTPGDITVSQINVSGAGGSGRVLLAAGSDILTAGSGPQITAQNVELRAGGLDAAGGRVGGTSASTALRLDVPQSVPGADGQNDVPSVLLLTTTAATNAQLANIQIVTGNFNISRADLPPGTPPVDNYLTTAFSNRTFQVVGGEPSIAVVNGPLGINTTGRFEIPSVNAAFAEGTDASNAQGEGILYIDWASFDPNVSLFGTVNPPICLPRDQQEEEESETPENAPATGAGSGGGSGCAVTTARYENESLGLPELRLVLTDRGMEWVRVRVPARVYSAPLRTAQSR